MIFHRGNKLPEEFVGTVHYLLFSEEKVVYAGKKDSPYFTQAVYDELEPKAEFLLCYSESVAYKACIIDSETAAEYGELLSLRELYKELDEDFFTIAVIAQGYVNWDRISQYCGHCGAKTELWSKDTAKKCTSCGTLFFPRISPAVIIAIQKGDSVLLAHNHNFREGLYGLIAGFIETGESAEEAVVREIREEVGIEVSDVTYHMSQSWPFPDSLMFGFSAQWKSGEVTPDGVEILDADWFNKDKLPPELPGPKTIAGALFRKITGYKG